MHHVVQYFCMQSVKLPCHDKKKIQITKIIENAQDNEQYRASSYVITNCVASCQRSNDLRDLISRPFETVRRGTRVQFLAPMMTSSCRILKDPLHLFFFFLKRPTLLTLNPFGG